MSLDIPCDVQAPPLVARLVERHGARWVDAANVAAVTAEPGDLVLFFSGDPVRFPECLDVAVVLPELQAAFPGRFAVGVVVPTDEDAVARRYGMQRWPSLVFLRDGRYVTAIAGMLDWTDYVARVAEALDLPATRAPTIGIAVVSADAAPSCH
ncbi:hydrogenase [Ideonella sp. A 288]|uniref:hydrogenase n=1 Tax=Ideonella sp. A 288 TaxID=1962181 RepID=UPI000B4B8776|nr:hydrogenase [Ideonella sp. A 288]